MYKRQARCREARLREGAFAPRLRRGAHAPSLRLAPASAATLRRVLNGFDPRRRCDHADELTHNLALVGVRKGAEELLTKLFDGLRAARPEWRPQIIACRREYLTAASSSVLARGDAGGGPAGRATGMGQPHQRRSQPRLHGLRKRTGGAPRLLAHATARLRECALAPRLLIGLDSRRRTRLVIGARRIMSLSCGAALTRPRSASRRVLRRVLIGLDPRRRWDPRYSNKKLTFGSVCPVGYARCRTAASSSSRIGAGSGP